jgi:hypothetical protein
MTNYLQAADDARRFLRGFAAIKELADAFESVGTLEQARTEADAALARLAPQIAVATTQVADAEKVMREADLYVLNKAADAQAAAEAVLAAAYAEAVTVRADAEALVEKAKAQAGGILSEAERLALDVSDVRDKMQAEVKALELRAADARAYLAKLQG